MMRYTAKAKQNQRASSRGRAVKVCASMLLTSCLCAGMLGCSGPSKTVAISEDENPDNSTDAVRTEFVSPVDLSDLDLEYSKRDVDPSYDEAAATRITLSGTEASVSGEGADAENSTITIRDEGDYVITGSLENGSICVDASSEDKIHVIFNGVNIHNETGPAFIVENADKCFVTLADNTQNTLSDGSEYQLLGDDDNRNATVFSRDDLTINGNGALKVEANYHHAISSKDDLVITGGTYDVTSVQDAFHGNNCIKIKSGTFTINAGDDAFHFELLFLLDDGEVKVTSCTEGYEAEKVIINGGVTEIVSSDDGINASAADTGEGSSDTVEHQVFAGEDIDAPGKPEAIDPGRGDRRDGGEPPAMGGGDMAQGGMNGHVMPGASKECIILINGGVISVDSKGDGLDSNGYIQINGGDITIDQPDNRDDTALDYEYDAEISGGGVTVTRGNGEVVEYGPGEELRVL